jgi:small subunit ribosomal protein S17
MKKNTRRRLEGTVSSAKMMKTVKVRVNRSYRHPLYGKVIRTHKNYLVHDEIGCQPGDIVCIVESRPISKNKRWVVQEILRRTSEAELAAEREVIIEEPIIGEPIDEAEAVEEPEAVLDEPQGSTEEPEEVLEELQASTEEPEVEASESEAEE